MAYHLVYGRMPFNKLVYHCNEYNYKYGQWNAPQTVNMPTNVWEFYTTMGAFPSLLKITQVGDAGFEHDVDHKIYLNRISLYADGPTDDYHETGVVPGYAGIIVNADNGDNDNNALNGYYHTINKLFWSTTKARAMNSTSAAFAWTLPPRFLNWPQTTIAETTKLLSTQAISRA